MSAVDVEDLRRMSKMLSSMATEKQKLKVSCVIEKYRAKLFAIC